MGPEGWEACFCRDLAKCRLRCLEADLVATKGIQFQRFPTIMTHWVDLHLGATIKSLACNRHLAAPRNVAIFYSLFIFTVKALWACQVVPLNWGALKDAWGYVDVAQD